MHRYVERMTAIHTVLFDLDGTIIDSIDLIVDSYLHTFRSHGLPMLSREEIIHGIGTPLRTVFGAWTDDPATMESWIATYRGYNLAHHDTRVSAFPGMVPLIRTLAERHVPLGLVTSKNRVGAVRGLELVGLGDTMQVIVGADDVVKPKPDPEPVRRALDALDAAPEGTAFVGDSHHDIESGRAAGVTTIGVTWGPIAREHLVRAGAHHICDHPDEVQRLVLP